MKNDLISREEAIKAVHDFIGEHLDEDCIEWNGSEWLIREESIVDVLNGLPTAFKMDKVLDKLKCESCDECPLIANCASNFGDGFMEKIREIVKDGGVSE